MVTHTHMVCQLPMGLRALTEGLGVCVSHPPSSIAQSCFSYQQSLPTFYKIRFLIIWIRMVKLCTRNHDLDPKPLAAILEAGCLVQVTQKSVWWHLHCGLGFSPVPWSKSYQKMIKEKDKLFRPLEMQLVAVWEETSINSNLWGASLKNKEIGFQNNFPSLEMYTGIRKLNSTHSCLPGLRPEHRNGAFLSLKNWPSAPCPNIEVFF